MPRAILATEDNIDLIVLEGQNHELNLEHIRDDLKYDAHYGDFYVIMDGSVETGNATCTTMGAVDFADTWKFKDTEKPRRFTEIERV